jgi:hypothetical protein
MYFAAVDFPRGTYKHYLYQTTSTDGINWAKPSLVMENAYAPCVIKDGDRYRMWYTWIDRHPWHTRYAESSNGTTWKLHDTPCIVMDQPWERKDQVYPFVIKSGDTWLMLYGCYWNDDKHTALGFAASRDGLTWAKHPDNPVFRPEPKHDWESNFHHQPVRTAPSRRQFPPLVRRTQTTAVEQPLLCHRHRPLERPGKMKEGFSHSNRRRYLFTVLVTFAAGVIGFLTGSMWNEETPDPLRLSPVNRPPATSDRSPPQPQRGKDSTVAAEPAVENLPPSAHMPPHCLRRNSASAMPNSSAARIPILCRTMTMTIESCFPALRYARLL